MKRLKAFIAFFCLSNLMVFGFMAPAYGGVSLTGSGETVSESELETKVSDATEQIEWIVFAVAGAVAGIVILITGILWLVGKRELVMSNAINIVGGTMVLILGGGLFQLLVNKLI